MTARGEEPPPGDPRRSAPAALRNRDAIARELVRAAPDRGRALEIASGSGEHVVHFAALLPGLTWHPTDPDPGQRASIAAWVVAEGLDNVAAPRALDVTVPGWAEDEPEADFLVLINLLHLIPDAAAWIALEGLARVLAPGGVAAIYGPFLRDGAATSPGDAAFHAELRARSPAGGYKDVAEVIARLASHGLRHRETVAMPANNLLLMFDRPA
jgi:hypothetical protein